MPPLKRLLPPILAFVLLTACRAPAVLPTPTATPSPTPQPPTSTFTPAFEEMQLPQLPAPALQGYFPLERAGGLEYQCYGAGSPTVIVEAGGGDKPTQSASWNAVILGVAPVTRICIYDRWPVDSVQIGAENLHRLLSGVPIPSPYILAAHSLGGWYARVFAHLYPQEVVGLLLVDTSPTSPEAGIIYATAYPTLSANEPPSVTQNRMSETAIYSGEMPSMDGLDMDASNAQVRQAGSFGDLPLVVIAHTPGLLELSQIDPAFQAQYAALFVQIEADQARLSTKGVFIQAHTHQHFISEYEPQIVIDALNQMLAGLRNK
jgi:pimeloyl-ACP methyl ester carboxylesterase